MDAADSSSTAPAFGSVDTPLVALTLRTSGQPPLNSVDKPAGWDDLRGNDEIQFEPIVPINEVREPTWFDEVLRSSFAGLGELLAPVARLLGASWSWLQWVLLALAVAFFLYMAARTFGPLARKKAAARAAVSESEWVPSAQESIALLEDADKLAAQGRFDEATHLLLQRSVSHISAARPDWVEPSSTARELAALPALSQTARAAYANFADAAIEGAARPTGPRDIARGKAR